MPVFDYVAGAAFVVTVYLWSRKVSSRRGYPLPPGPRPVPILGNVKDLTSKELWLRATEWGRTYGDVVYLHVFGQGLVFLNSSKAAFDLLQDRGGIYSDKPPLVMAGELCGCENMVAFTRYGEKSRRQRNLLNKAFGQRNIPAYHSIIDKRTNDLLRRLVEDPADYVSHFRRYAGGLTLNVVYGYEPAPGKDKLLDLAEECVDILANRIASGGGIWPVDVLPFLKHLPTWVPGAGFKRKAAEWKAKMEEFTDKPYEYLKSRMKSGDYAPSFCSTLIENSDQKLTDEYEFDLKWTANSMYSASGDTTITTLSLFLLGILERPDALARAQKEIDEVCGDRLPNFDDRPSLPFTNAILSETWRWGAAVPLSLPHRLMEDDIYEGMFIPAGSLVFGNVWSMVRDETLFPDAQSFRPERYMGTDPVKAKAMDPRRYVFGFGRECPGQHLVESSIWLLMARMLATLDICHLLDEEGNVVKPSVEFNNSVFRTPTYFPCSIKPRSGEALRSILGTADLE